MKWLIYLLLIFNVAFFAWQYRTTGLVRPAPLPPVSSVGQAKQLLLLSEVAPSALRAREVASPLTRSLVSHSRTSVGSPVVAGAPPESAESSKSTPGIAAADPATRGAGEAHGRRCYAVGPFGKDEVVDDIIGWLRSEGGAAELRWDERQTPKSYWVYIPPRSSTEEARAMLRRLAADGVQDYVRIMRGPMRNAVSLGIFSKRESADRRMADLRRRGYVPSIDTRYQKERVQWLDVSFPAAMQAPTLAFHKKFPTTELAVADCP